MNYVLADSITGPINTDEFIAVQIYNVKKVSHIIKVLNERFPLPLHKHLRRVKTTTVQDQKTIHVLLCLSSDTTDISPHLHHNLLRDTSIDLNDLCAECYCCQAATQQPITRAQYTHCRGLWPTFFHEDKELEKQLVVVEYSEFDKSCIKTAQDVSQHSTGSYKCGAVIADVSRSKVVGVGCSLANEHPLRHSVMVAIDSVAHGQGGGVWPQTITQPFSAFLSEPISDSDRPAVRKRKVVDGGGERAEEYLCTGYTAYLTHEPCTMCAMSLVHSRIKHVYYNKTSEAGALGTLYKLHCTPQLNHNFTVTTRSLDLVVDAAPSDDKLTATAGALHNQPAAQGVRDITGINLTNPNS